VRTASVCVSAPPLSGRYWRIRYESSIVDGGDYRTVVVYKDSQEMIKLDPVPNEWTVLHTAKKTPNFLALHVELYRSIELSRSDVLFSPGCELLLLIGRLIIPGWPRRRSSDMQGTFRDARAINPLGAFPENEMTGTHRLSESLPSLTGFLSV
jgi:hypothetical protein